MRTLTIHHLLHLNPNLIKETQAANKDPPTSPSSFSLIRHPPLIAIIVETFATHRRSLLRRFLELFIHHDSVSYAG